tara:strand:- start:6303 stop:6974 length:672 start_codon:yes stop_codon:yes gene_type:complete
MTNTNNGIPVGIGYDSKNNAKSLMEIDSIQVSQVSATTYLNLPAGGGGGVTTLSGLGDVCNDVAVAGRPLVWDAVTSKWCGSAIDLHQISVNETAIAAGDASTVALSGYVSTNAGAISTNTTNIGTNTTNIATNAAGITYVSAVVVEELYISSTGLSAAIDGKQTLHVNLTELAALSLARGDILYVNAAGELVALSAAGNTGKTLQLVNNESGHPLPTWVLVE